MVGSSPVTTPKITPGIELMKLKKGTRFVRKLMLDIEPTTATGIDQKMMSATTNEMVATI